MTSTDIYGYITALEARCASLEEECRALKARVGKETDMTKFYAVALTTEEVARLHGVGVVRVRDYARRGLIPLHPNSTDAKLLFRASDALTLDFQALKAAKSERKWFHGCTTSEA